MCKNANRRLFAVRWKDFNRDECETCGKGGVLLCCDGCPAAYHATCCHPPYADMDSVPDGAWYCMSCQIRRRWVERVKRTPTNRYSHTPTGGLNMGAPFSPAAQQNWMPQYPTPEANGGDDDEDADTDEVTRNAPTSVFGCRHDWLFLFDGC